MGFSFLTLMGIKVSNRNLAVSKEMGEDGRVERWRKRTNAIIFKQSKDLHVGSGVDFDFLQEAKLKPKFGRRGKIALTLI